MSVGRPDGRPLSFCGRPGGRPLQPVHVGAQQSTGPVDRAAAAADDDSLLLLMLLIPLLWILVVVDFLDFLSLPTSCRHDHNAPKKLLNLLWMGKLRSESKDVHEQVYFLPEFGTVHVD